ncbi:MAG: hypothetical protein ACEY3M_02220, partial [Wolbachia sp.]
GDIEFQNMKFLYIFNITLGSLSYPFLKILKSIQNRFQKPELYYFKLHQYYSQKKITEYQ